MSGSNQHLQSPKLPATPASPWMASAIEEAAEEQQHLAQKFQATEEEMKKKKLQTETKTSACRDAKAAGLPKDNDEAVKYDSDEGSNNYDVKEEETLTSATTEKQKWSFYNWLFFAR